jgi:hypothetical protein
MVEPSNTDDATIAPVCPWCSAPLTAADIETCPSCNAQLRGEVVEQLPGLTAIDAQAIIRAKNPPKRRSRLLSWLSGDTPEEDILRPGDAKAVAFPDLDVRREMLKLEIERDLAEMQAEADAMLAEAAAEGRVLDIPPDLVEAAGLKHLVPAGEGDAPAAAADATEPEAEQPA